MDIMRTFSVRGSEAFTLVEMMVSVAIFGILSVALATLFAKNAERNAISINEAQMTEQVSDFSDALESYLSNTTRVINCNCFSTSGACLFDDTNFPAPSCMTAGLEGFCVPPTSAQVDFETEDANDPTQLAPTAVAGHCDPEGAQPRSNPQVSGSSWARGCKRRLRLVYVAPTRMNTVGATTKVGTPGELQIWDIDGAGVQIGATPVHRLPGVYYFRCGRPPQVPGPPPLKPAAAQFRFEIRAKSRANNANVSTLPQRVPEGWFPGTSATPADSTFTEGTHRNVRADVSFRNLNVPGVHFGKPSSILSCLSNGSASASSAECCSGYLIGGACSSAPVCMTKGQPGTTDSCCSHMADSGNCI
jgi:prepilin-type N-terminal cleavage/methylation domain-containing protein